MTFSNYTRNELARVIPSARCCRIAELSALYDLDGFILGRKNSIWILTIHRLLLPEKSGCFCAVFTPPGCPFRSYLSNRARAAPKPVPCAFWAKKRWAGSTETLGIRMFWTVMGGCPEK